MSGGRWAVGGGRTLEGEAEADADGDLKSAEEFAVAR